MDKVYLDKDKALDVLYAESDEYEFVESKLIGQGRWSIRCRLVARRVSDGALFIAYYSKGATECQEERPWDDEKVVEFLPAIEILVKDYSTVV